ncbi:putative ATP-binding protein [Anaerovibrio sp. JC8]|uniref:ATP-binding protein n=1 Tax=Anaerovibrio sp. JC8 TaxID=1240085 RepID=UPI000A0D0192|nr:ATP-binding protein [Anaerovibrio sp. JC8]ORU00830.1 putative ATP-binding protein [Anaerovibrio sp. JC8]
MEKFVHDFITKPESFYLEDDNRLHVPVAGKLKNEDVVFLKIDEVTFDEKAPRKEALENVLSTMRVQGVNFLYLIVGDGKKVSFYYGLAKDIVQVSHKQYGIKKLGKEVLKRSLEGNFRGSIISEVSEADTNAILSNIQSMKYIQTFDGVPGVSKDNEKYQGLDRLVDIMLGDVFAVVVTAKHLPYAAVRKIEQNIYAFCNNLAPIAKKSVQNSNSDSKTEVKSTATGINESIADSNSKAETNNFGISNQETRQETTTFDDDSSRTQSTGTTDSSKTGSKSITEGTTKTNGNSKTVTEGDNITKGQSSSENVEYINKEAQDWLKYIDEVLLKRLDYGKGKGVFLSTVTIFTNSPNSKIKLENTITALFSSDVGNQVPLRAKALDTDGEYIKTIKNLQIPIGEFIEPIKSTEVFTRAALSQYTTNQKAFLANWFSTGELAILAGLPQKETVGLSLREEVEFGLNYKDNINECDKLHLGSLVQSGRVLDNIQINLDRGELNKHIFVTGVTGSGKTTTCQKILLESGMPFLVIEPAKTEYRVLTRDYDDILIFTLGKDKVAPFRLNPLEFFKHESISSHVDMLKASIESAFDMEAAIPQIIEKAIYESYQQCGWNIADDTNSLYDDPFADDVEAFPTLAEVIKNCKKVVDEQGFDERLKNDYIGSINARLQGLIVGAKGMMLNTRRSINFRDLVHRRVILEIEDIRSGAEKSLVMGFIMSNLIEAIKAEYFVDTTGFKHITLVEEAHRLLAKYEPGDSLSKKQGVETFANMLAEVRKYGESLIIADQIPAKLTPEVLKNTNTKIVHKLFAQDDKDAVGNTMALTKEQVKYLSYLDPGRVVAFSPGWEKALQVQVLKKTNTTSGKLIDEETIRRRVIEYYAKDYKKNFFYGLGVLLEKPDIDKVNLLLSSAHLFDELDKEYIHIIDKSEVTDKFRKLCDEVEKMIGFEGVQRYFIRRFYHVDKNDKENLIVQALNIMFNNMQNGITSFADMDIIVSNGLSSKRRI